MKRFRSVLGTRIKVLGASAVLLAAGLTASPIMATQAHAAYGPCNTTTWRDVPSLGDNDHLLPARSGNGISCYMGYLQGSRAAVEALQTAITQCYPGTWAAAKINSTSANGSGGFDGIYGAGTAAAVEWLQKNRLNLTGSNADGVYGPKTRSAMKWPVYYHGARLYSCINSAGI